MFEKLEEKLTLFGNSMKNGAESISLNAKVDDAKKKIATLYGEIGEKYYTDNKGNAPAGYEENFEKVDGLFKEIDDCADQIKKLAGIRTCPGCGADVEKGYRFCIMCGTKMPEEEKPSKRAVCDKCGQEAEEGALFCINCGARLPSIKEKKKEEFCSRCGVKLVEGALFCTTCGQKVEIPEEPEIPDVPELDEEPAASEVQETAENTEVQEEPADI